MNTLKEKRLAAGLTQADVARALHTTCRSIVGIWEQGKRRPSDQSIYRLCTILRCSPAELGFSNVRPASKLRILRLTRGMTIAAVSKALHMHPETISTWESGTHTPSSENVSRLCTLFGCASEALGFPPKVAKIPPDQRNTLVVGYLNAISYVIAKNRTLVEAARLCYDDLYQDMACRLIKTVDSYDSQKGPLKPRVFNALQWELQNYAKKTNAGGMYGLPPNTRPVFCSFETMTEAGFQFAASIDHY